MDCANLVDSKSAASNYTQQIERALANHDADSVLTRIDDEIKGCSPKATADLVKAIDAELVAKGLLRPLIVDYATKNIQSLDEIRRSPSIRFGTSINRHSSEITTTSLQNVLAKDIGHGGAMPLERMVIQEMLNHFKEIADPTGANAGKRGTAIGLSQLQQYRNGARK